MSAHVCHAAGCKTIVPPSMFMCRSHWFALPDDLRAAVIAAQRPGLNRENVGALDRAREWIAANGK